MKNEILKECITEYFENKVFFNSWFRKHGKSYVFIFKKNLTVTDIQYAELLALIKTNIKINKHNNSSGIQFLAVADFNDATRKLFETFGYSNNTTEKDNISNILCECYSSILEHIVVVDPFRGSCAVFIPYNMELDIENICAQSGYIHSCGTGIFIRKVNKSDKETFYNNLKNYLISNSSEEKIPFIVYSHEDFTPFDRENKDSIINGLDNLKFYIEKFYMKSVPLTQIIHEMEDDPFFQEKLDITKPGNFIEKIKGDHKNSIWLIVDKSIGKHINIPSQDMFFICYDQKFINENPYHLFDENKPGWIDHTTIPHTLMGAMLNIAISTSRVQNRGTQKIKILDPFVGSGTTYLETLKYPDIEFRGSDLSQLTPLVTKDNLSFFSLDYKDLIELYLEILCCELLVEKEKVEIDEHHVSFISGQIKETKKELSEIDGGLKQKKELSEICEGAKNTHSKVMNFFTKLLDKYPDLAEVPHEEITDELCDLNKRVIFYLFLKAHKRNYMAFMRKSKNWDSAFSKEIADLRRQIKNYIKLKKRVVINQEAKCNLTIKYKANYSYACSINTSLFTSYISDGQVEKSIIGMRDIIAELKDSFDEQNFFDIIITDPPYGFNTDEDISSFAILYHEMTTLILKCLKPHGQLIICLPEISNVGKPIHSFTQKEIVKHQIIVAACENGIKLISPVDILPRPIWLFKAPYFWESEKALRRTILHFIIS